MNDLLLYSLILAVSLSSCARPLDIPVEESMARVSVGLRVSVDADDTKGVEDDVIRNLWIVQFNGTDEDSKVLGKPVYIEDFASFSGSVELVPTRDECSIFFFANTYERYGEFLIDSSSSIADILDMKRRVRNEHSILGSAGDMDDDGESDYYVLLNARVNPGRIDEDLEFIDVVLKRNVAKATATVIVGEAALGNNLKVESIQFCSVPSVSYYMTDRALSAPYPLIQDFEKVNYTAVPWCPDLEGGTMMTVQAFLPVNLRGTGQVGSTQSEKNKYAPDGATYLLVNASYGDHNQYPITYTFYLGSDMSSDYNIRANTSYSFTFTITDIGDADSDYRITNWGLEDFTDTEKYPLSNSYILNPAPMKDSWRYFRIPVEKANIFWGGGGYESNVNYLLNNKDWVCYVLASDFEITEDNFRIETPSRAQNDTYFEVAVKSGVEGNVIVAAGSNSYSVSWSWHLWITDYNPSMANDLSPTPGKYIYPVTGGSVHRYHSNAEGGFWSKNPDVFMMDRNLGSFNADKFSSENRGYLYYQFGRKDPFLSSQSAYHYPEGSTSRAVRVNYADANAGDINSVRYSVQNPLSFVNLGTNGWTYDNDYSPSKHNGSIIWNDPTTAKGQVNEGKKSMFDPCPPGYRVPDHTVFEDFRYNDESKLNSPTTNVLSEGSAQTVLKRRFNSFTDVKGLQYWPDDGNDVPEQIIYFPATGYYTDTGTTLKLSSNGAWTTIWASTPSTVKNANRLFGRVGYVGTGSTASKARGCPVRCIVDR